MNLSENRITTLAPIPQPKLLNVDLSANRINNCEDFGGHNNLVSLNLSKNHLESASGLKACPKLQDLNLAKNKLTSVKELEDMPNLRKLDLSQNKFEELKDMPHLPALEQLNMSNNKLKDKACIMALAKYSTLHTLTMMECPFTEELGDGFKGEVLLELGLDLPNLKMINDEEVTPEDWDASKEARAEREKAKKEAEEEAARLAAEAAEAENAPKED